MSRRIICPNTTFEAIKTILIFLKPSGKLTIKQLSEQTNSSKTWINGALPIMGELGLIYRGKEQYIGITSKGIDLVNYLEENNDNKLKVLSEEIYKNSDILRIAKKILKDTPKISMAKFGEKIAEELNIPKDERWKNETTYVKVARSCKSILGGLQIIEYIPHKHKRKNINRFRNKLMPYASTVLLDKQLDRFTKNENDMYRLPAEELTQYQRQRETDYFNSAISLRLIDRVPGNDYLYKLTSSGRRLKEVKDLSEHAQIFQDILLKNPHVVNILRIIQNNYDGIDSEEIGQVLKEYNDTKWGVGTKRSYGSNFLNWLLESDIMIKRGRKHKYTFQPHFIESDNYKKYFSGESTVNKETKHIDAIKQIHITVKQPSISQNIKSIFDSLVANLNWIINTLDDLPFSDIKRRTVIDDCLNRLVDNTDDNLKPTFILLHQIIEEAYKSNNKVLITACLQHLARIKCMNESNIDT